MPRKKRNTAVSDDPATDNVDNIEVADSDSTESAESESVNDMSTIIDPQVDDEALESDGEVDLDKLQTDFMFRGPVNLRLLVESQAEDANLNPSQFLRKIVADHVGYRLQSNTARSSMSDDEKARRKAELAEKAKAERARVKALLNQARAEADISTGKQYKIYLVWVGRSKWV